MAGSNCLIQCVLQALSRNYALEEEIDEAELDDELAAIDEQLQLESEVRPPSVPCCFSLAGALLCGRSHN